MGPTLVGSRRVGMRTVARLSQVRERFVHSVADHSQVRTVDDVDVYDLVVRQLTCQSSAALHRTAVRRRRRSVESSTVVPMTLSMVPMVRATEVRLKEALVQSFIDSG